MSALRRVVAMSLNATLRTYLSPANLMWIVAIPIILSLIISLWVGGQSVAPWADEESPTRALGEMTRAENSQR